jgi:CheY-like chemotaxis protein
MISAAKRAIILIVEDELLIRTNAVEMIEEAGFEVLEAANADEAIMILEARSDIRIVFTDIQMPGSMNGLKLAAAVRGRWPPIKIIATSGHHAIRDGELPEGSAFLQKPYSSDAVGRALRDMIAR